MYGVVSRKAGARPVPWDLTAGVRWEYGGSSRRQGIMRLTKRSVASICSPLRLRQQRPYDCCRASSTAAAASTPTFHAAALDALLQHDNNNDAAIGGGRDNGNASPVLLIELLQLRPGAEPVWREHNAIAAREHGGRCIKSLRPFVSGGGGGSSSRSHMSSLLLGDPSRHTLDRIEIHEYPNARSAHAALTAPQLMRMRGEAIYQANDGCGGDHRRSGSMLLGAQRSALFAGLPSFEEAGGECTPVDTGPPRPPSACPFRGEATAHPSAWDGLQNAPSDHMYRLRVIIIAIRTLELMTEIYVLLPILVLLMTRSRYEINILYNPALAAGAVIFSEPQRLDWLTWAATPPVDSCACARALSDELDAPAVTAHRYAFNLIRMPDRAAYQEYSSHFAELPQRYGMKFVEVASLQADANLSVLLGAPPGQDGGSFDLMALVYFPSSGCFIKAWSDEVRARLRNLHLTGGELVLYE